MAPMLLCSCILGFGQVLFSPTAAVDAAVLLSTDLINSHVYFHCIINYIATLG